MFSGFSSCSARAPWLRYMSSRARTLVAVVHGLGCSAARGIFLDQRSNLCLLHRQEDCFALNHQRSPVLAVLYVTCHHMSL